MLFRLIKLVCLCALINLSGCFGAVAELPHPYLKTANDFELRAEQALQLGQYNQAFQLYGRALAVHVRLDDPATVARLLLNQFQIALTIESLDRAESAQTQLTELLQNYPVDNATQHLALLNANLAIFQQNWQEAEAQLNLVSTSETRLYPSALVSRAVLYQKTGRDTSEVETRAYNAAAEQPLLLARLQRLSAEQAIARADIDAATALINSAKQSYQVVYYLPGIAECMVLEAEVYELQQQAEQAEARRKHALDIWQHIGNRAAATRLTAQNRHR